MTFKLVNTWSFESFFQTLPAMAIAMTESGNKSIMNSWKLNPSIWCNSRNNYNSSQGFKYWYQSLYDLSIRTLWHQYGSGIDSTYWNITKKKKRKKKNHWYSTGRYCQYALVWNGMTGICSYEWFEHPSTHNVACFISEADNTVLFRQFLNPWFNVIGFYI